MGTKVEDFAQGACGCGGVRFALQAPPMFVNCCHCRDCQRQTGSAFVINAVIETANVRVDAGSLATVIMPSDSGRPHRIHRCAECGTALWSNYGARDAVRFVRVATLEERDGIVPDAHIFTRSKLPWVTLPADRPAFEVFYDLPSLWPPAAQARRRAATS